MKQLFRIFLLTAVMVDVADMALAQTNNNGFNNAPTNNGVNNAPANNGFNNAPTNNGVNNAPANPGAVVGPAVPRVNTPRVNSPTSPVRNNVQRTVAPPTNLVIDQAVVKQNTLLTGAAPAPAVQPANQRLARDGFYVRPNVELLLVPSMSAFTKNVGSIGLGAGGGFTLGYEVSKFQIELAVNYQYYGSKGSFDQTAQSAASKVKITSTVDSGEQFIPITVGFNYVIPLTSSGVFAITPGLAGGLWVHRVNRVIRQNGYNIATGLPIDLGTVGLGDLPTSDSNIEVKVLIAPSLALEVQPFDNLSFHVTGKVYIVPGGYSDNYAATTRAALADISTFNLEPAYNTVDTMFWYSSVNIGMQYKF